MFRLILFPRNLTIFPAIDERRSKLKLALKHIANGMNNLVVFIMFSKLNAFLQVLRMSYIYCLFSFVLPRLSASLVFWYVLI